MNDISAPHQCVDPRNLCGGRYRESRIVKFKELADLAVTKFVEVRLRGFECLTGYFVFERATAERDHAIALSNVLVDAVVNHLPLCCKPGEVASDIAFASRRTGEFHAVCAFGEREEVHVVRHEP